MGCVDLGAAIGFPVTLLRAHWRRGREQNARVAEVTLRGCGGRQSADAENSIQTVEISSNYQSIPLNSATTGT